jgi:hypothetical protein
MPTYPEFRALSVPKMARRRDDISIYVAGAVIKVEQFAVRVRGHGESSRSLDIGAAPRDTLVGYARTPRV